MEPKLPESQQAVYETLLDGVMMTLTTVSLRPETPGQTHRLKVRKIPQRDLGQMADVFKNAFGNESVEVAYYLGIAPETLDDLNLDDESQDAVIQEGRRLNFTRFKHFLARRLELVSITGQLPKVVQDLVLKFSQEQQSTITPKPSNSSQPTDTATR